MYRYDYVPEVLDTETWGFKIIISAVTSNSECDLPNTEIFCIAQQEGSRLSRMKECSKQDPAHAVCALLWNWTQQHSYTREPSCNSRHPLHGSPMTGTGVLFAKNLEVALHVCVHRFSGCLRRRAYYRSTDGMFSAEC